MGSKLKEENPELSSAELTKLRKQQWKDLADADRKPYLDAQVADQQRHATEIAAKEAARQQVEQQATDDGAQQDGAEPEQVETPPIDQASENVGSAAAGVGGDEADKGTKRKHQPVPSAPTLAEPAAPEVAPATSPA
eukprot:COSAG04_NODE_12219_length_664_cov_1.060177_1_plen_137_part_00